LHSRTTESGSAQIYHCDFASDDVWLGYRFDQYFAASAAQAYHELKEKKEGAENKDAPARK